MLTKIKNNEFLRNILTLMTGTSVAQAIPILVSPILTRIFTPEDFGIFALYMTIFSIFGVIAAGKYELSIILPEKDEDAIRLLSLSIIITISVSVILLLFFSFYKGTFSTFLGNSNLSKWLPFIPLSIFCFGIYQAMNNWFNRKKNYRIMSVNKIWQSGTTVSANLSLGYLNFGSGGLILGHLFGLLFGAFLMCLKFIKNFRQHYINFSFRPSIKLAKKYKDLPIYNAPTALLDTASLNAPTLILTKFFDSNVVGLFNLTTRVISAPSGIIASSFAQIYYQRLSNLRNQSQPLRPFVLKATLILGLIALIPLITLLLFAPSLFALVFGENWRVAGEYAQILSIAYAIRFVVSPLSSIFIVQGKIKLGSLWQTIYFLTTLLALFIGSQFGIESFIRVYTVHEILLYIFYYYLIIRVAK